MSEKKKLIIDVDTGSDDAIALIMAMLSPDLELLAITAVNGNCPVENTTDNSLRVVDMMKKKVPVYKGCDRPMVAELLPERHTYRLQPMEAELDGEIVTYHHPVITELEPAVSKEQPISAVRFLIDRLLNSDGDITIAAVGPLTNLGVAMRADPRIIPKIKKLYIMGGGHLQANMTAGSEFNIWKDPEAAQIVLTSGCPIMLVSLDATHRAYVTKEESERIRGIGTKAAQVTADLIDSRAKVYNALQPLNCAPYDSSPPHDALAVLAVSDESLITEAPLKRVDVDLGGSFADGMTVVDPRVRSNEPKNVQFAYNVDRDRFVNKIISLLESERA